MMYWGWFLQKPEAKDDPQFELISNLYNQVKEKSSGGSANASSSTSANSNNSDKKPKKKKTATKTTAQQQMDLAGNIVG